MTANVSDGDEDQELQLNWRGKPEDGQRVEQGVAAESDEQLQASTTHPHAQLSGKRRTRRGRRREKEWLPL